MLPRFSVSLRVPGFSAELGVDSLSLPRDSALRAIGALGLIQPAPEGPSLILPKDDAGVAADIEAWRKQNDQRSALLTYREEGTERVETVWLDVTPGPGSSISVQFLTLPMAGSWFESITSPLFAVDRLLSRKAALPAGVQEPLEEVRQLLIATRDGRAWANSEPATVADRYLYGSDARLLALLNAWKAFGTAVGAREGQALEKACTASLTKLSPSLLRNEAQPLHQVFDGVRAMWNVNRCSFQVLRTLVIAAAQPFKPIAPQELVAGLREQLVHLYQTVHATTGNSEVVGELIEGRVRRLLEQWVFPLKVSSGAIASVGRGRQIDAMVWDNQAAPSLLTESHVAVIHPDSLKGIIEIKSNVTDIEDWAGRIWELHLDLSIYHREGMRSAPPVMGLLVWHDDSYERVLARSAGQVHVLLTRRKDGEYQVNDQALFELVRVVFHDIFGHLEWRDLGK